MLMNHSNLYIIHKINHLGYQKSSFLLSQSFPMKYT